MKAMFEEVVDEIIQDFDPDERPRHLVKNLKISYTIPTKKWQNMFFKDRRLPSGNEQEQGRQVRN